MQISDYAFAKCSSLDNVTFPSSMTSISVSSFEDCTSLQNLDLGNSLNIIGPSAFKNCTKLNGIEIPETLYGLGVQSFENCVSLPNVAIRSISSVGREAFKGCAGLKWVSLSSKTTSLGENSFAGCTGIEFVRSYANYPPEGLVNFPEEVVANGILFVPENSVDFYMDSPTWEDWNAILPHSDQVFVSAVSISSENETLKVSQTVKLDANATPDDAYNKDILWRTSDTEVAVVDADGLVTALSVGTATISAIAADGSNRKAVCVLTVEPTLAERIEITSNATSLKKGRNMQLSATVYPATTTNANVTWSSSNQYLATVTNEGVVTAKSAGQVTISAKAADNSGIVATYNLTIVPPTKGDSNDNDAVTISDAVNTANYAVGNEVVNFCFEAADVNSDNRVTISDASATIGIVLEQEVETSSFAMAFAKARAKGVEKDVLVIADYNAKAGETATLFVTLGNSIDYVAMQADIVVPEGMTLVGVKAGNRAAAFHSLATRRIDDRTMRVALFDLENNAFADNDEAILELTVKINTLTNADVELFNILASDAQAIEYVLTSTGGHNNELSGIESVNYGNVRIEAVNDVINVYNAEGCEVAIYGVDGTVFSHFTATANVESRKVVKGVYIVAAGKKVNKVIVK